MQARNVESTIGRIAGLADPVRRTLYFYVAQSPGEVSRDQAARSVHIARPLAAFHLDKLVEQGLLEASYRRLTNRRGPGAGRPAKLYRRSGIQVDVSLPPRQYELAARLFASAAAASAPATRREAIWPWRAAAATPDGAPRARLRAVPRRGRGDPATQLPLRRSGARLSPADVRNERGASGRSGAGARGRRVHGGARPAAGNVLRGVEDNGLGRSRLVIVPGSAID